MASLTGWSICYQDTYNVNMQAAIPTILAACNKNKILMACKQNVAANYQLVAAGPLTYIVRCESYDPALVGDPLVSNRYHQTTWVAVVGPAGA